MPGCLPPPPPIQLKYFNNSLQEWQIKLIIINNNVKCCFFAVSAVSVLAFDFERGQLDRALISRRAGRAGR